MSAAVTTRRRTNRPIDGEHFDSRLVDGEQFDSRLVDGEHFDTASTS